MSEQALPREVWGRALLRGAAVGILNCVVLIAISLVWAGAAASSFDVIFVLLLGLVAAPLVLVERWGRTGSRHGWWALACLVLAALGFVMAWIQMTYLSELARLGSPAAALEVLLFEGRDLLAMGAETRAVLCAFAPPFALVLWLRAKGWGLGAQCGIGLAAAQLISLASLIGFQGFPQVRWLVGAPWCSPEVGTFLFLQPIVLPLALPVIDRVLDGWQARRVTRREERRAQGLW